MMLLSHTDIKTLMFFEKLTETYFAYIRPKKEKNISKSYMIPYLFILQALIDFWAKTSRT